MTLEELLQTPLMRGAQVIAGSQGLVRDVSWCVTNSAIKPDSIVMPGLLLLIAEREEGKHIEDYLGFVEESLVAGIVYFESQITGDEEHKRAIQTFDEYKIPLIKLPKGTNAITFMKRFVAAYSTHLSENYRREEWLHELCYGSGLAGGETMARAYGFNPDYTYYCSIFTLRDAEKLGHVAREMESEAVRGFVTKILSHEDARVLSYISERHIVAFLPWNAENNTTRLRKRVIETATQMRNSITNLKWQVVVGSCARTLSEFHESYLGALRTQEVIEMLSVHEKASFYDDWYMHMLLLKEPRLELREHMSETLEPILDAPDLLETLTNYLVYGENLKETAERTFIHVNTLKYRLKRIQELLECDLRDPNVRFRLRMAITIERYLRN